MQRVSKMYRFFEETKQIIENKIILSKENSHHIQNVLRMRDDEDFEVVLDDKVHLVNIYQRDKDFLQVDIKDTYEIVNESPIKINLFQGLPKSDKLELIIQKAVELGVDQISPFSSSRTIVKWDVKKAEKKLKRYEEISHAAAKQSKRGYIPKVNDVIKFEDIAEQMNDSLTILAYENDGKSLRQVLKENKYSNVNIIIGPEGGFSETEVDYLAEKGASIVHLGNRILRTETASIALLAMVQYEIGDINEEI